MSALPFLKSRVIPTSFCREGCAFRRLSLVYCFRPPLAANGRVPMLIFSLSLCFCVLRLASTVYLTVRWVPPWLHPTGRRVAFFFSSFFSFPCRSVLPSRLPSFSADLHCFGATPFSFCFPCARRFYAEAPPLSEVRGQDQIFF